MKTYAMFLQLFAEGEAAAAPAGGGAETGTAAGTGDFQIGDTLADGSAVQDARVAAALNRQIKRHPEMRERYRAQVQPAEAAPGTQPAQEGPDQQVQPGEAGQTPEETLESRWNELKKGEFKDLYGRDIQKGIRDRFKNQDDANAKLTAMQPMLDALMKKAGVDSVDELQKIVLDDDSIYEEDAEQLGMTVQGFKAYKEMQAENQQYKRAQEQAQIRSHVGQLRQQGEELKQTFPGFDFETEMQSQDFRQMTAPKAFGGAGLSVRQAYIALHEAELVPQLMSYGMERAQQQMGQTIQAQGMRPAEGAMSSRNPAAAEPKINPKNLTPAERRAYKKMAMSGKYVSFDR